MLINRKAELEQSEQDVQDYLQQRPGEIDAGIADTNSVIDASRKTSNDSVLDIIKEINPNAVSAAAPGIQRGNEDLAGANESAMASRKSKQNQARFATTFNFAYGRLVAAGYDSAKARETAMQFALDTQRQQDSSAANAKARQVALQKQDIMDSFASKKLALDRKYEDDRRKSAITNTVMRSFFGLAGAGAGFLVGGPAGAVVGGTAASSAAPNDPGPSSGRVASKEDYA